MKTKHMNLVRSSWLMLVGLMLLVSCSLDNRVIEKPVFLASNTTSIEVSKVSLTDSTTVLDIFARYQPKYWIRIAGSSYLTDDKETHIRYSRESVSNWIKSSGCLNRVKRSSN